MVIPSKSERGQTPRKITYMWNLKYDTNEPIYQAESRTQRTDLWLPRGKGLGEKREGIWG